MALNLKPFTKIVGPEFDERPAMNEVNSQIYESLINFFISSKKGVIFIY